MNFNLDWENTNYAWFFILIPIALWIVWFHKNWQEKTQKDYADKPLLDKILSKNSYKINAIKNGLWITAIFFLILTIMGPLMGHEKSKVKQEGIDIVYVLDVSKSMDAQDIAPSRLEKAKKIISQSINQLSGDRISIVLFAGGAYNLLPLTNDYATANLYLSNTETDIISEQGTNYPLALRQALASLPDNTSSDKIIFLLSDGENHQGDFSETIEELKKRNIKVNTVVLGTESGAPIPIKENGTILDYKKDEKNELIITKPSLRILKDIAKQTNGKFINEQNTNAIVSALHSSFYKMQKSKNKVTEILTKKQRYQWLGGLVFILLLFEMSWISRTKKDE